MDQTATGTGRTTISSSSWSSAPTAAFAGEATSDIGQTTGVEGISFSSQGSGVTGRSSATSGGVGVLGVADAGVAVLGRGGEQGVQGVGSGVEAKGVVGFASDTSAALGPFGVWGEAHSPTGVGVLGYSGEPTIAGVTYPTVSVGVYGSAARDSKARAVWGTTTLGTGVHGDATSGTGVRAVATTGVALAVSGRATFSRAGRTSIPKGRTSVDITVAGGLASTAFVVATLQIHRTGVYVAAVRPNYPSAGQARIYLNKIASSTSSTPVGWLVVG